MDKSKKFHIELEDRVVDILNNVKEKKDGDVNTNENTNVDTTEDENEINELERMMEEEKQNF